MFDNKCVPVICQQKVQSILFTEELQCIKLITVYELPGPFAALTAAHENNYPDIEFVSFGDFNRCELQALPKLHGFLNDQTF